MYGSLEDIPNHSEGVKDDFEFQSKIKIKDILLKNPNYNLFSEYRGTFSLELARKKEEIDFFALGHPLINNILDYCISDEFKGNLSVLNLNRKVLERFYDLESKYKEELYLFIFSVKFQGYIIENQIIAIVVDEYGNEIKNFADIILNIENFNELFLVKDAPEKLNIGYNIISKLQQEAKKIVKSKTSIWKREIKTLNDAIFNQERKKKEKIFSHKKRTLNFKIESLNQTLARNKNKRLTPRQLQNIKKMTDLTKKQERLNKLKKLEEDIKFIIKDLNLTKKKLDDLSFEYEDLKNEMIKRNLSKFFTNLLSFSLLKIVD
ncbi:hypothetical protein ES703_63908 [subsurface metagenome]